MQVNLLPDAPPGEGVGGGHRRRAGCAAIARGWRCLLWATLVGLGAAAGRVAAQAPAAGPWPFDQRERDEAVRALPLGELDEPARAKLLPVVTRPSMFRRLPVQTVECDPDLYVFLVRYPEVVVNMWQLMGVTKVQVRRTGPFTFEASDGAGTVSKVDLVYGRPDLHLFHALGTYEGPLLGCRVDAACVMLLHSTFSRREGRAYVSSYLDVFLRLDDPGAELLAKTLQPLVGKAVDGNFAESTRFLGQVSQASETNGAGMQLLATRLANVDAPIRQTFAQHAEAVYHRAVLRSGGAVTGSAAESAWRDAAPGGTGPAAPVTPAASRSLPAATAPVWHTPGYRR